jgi:hypothetical protein
MGAFLTKSTLPNTPEEPKEVDVLEKATDVITEAYSAINQSERAATTTNSDPSSSPVETPEPTAVSDVAPVAPAVPVASDVEPVAEPVAEPVVPITPVTPVVLVAEPVVESVAPVAPVVEHAISVPTPKVVTMDVDPVPNQNVTVRKNKKNKH